MTPGNLRCQLRLCKSGQPASVGVNENIGDVSFRTAICAECATVLGMTEGRDLPEKCNIILTNHYARWSKP